MLITKICYTCKEEKDITAFMKKASSRDSFHYDCKECARKKRQQYITRIKKIIVIPEEKICACCGLLKKSEFFNKDSKRLNGLSPYCKDCGHKKYLDFVERNGDAFKIRNRVKARAWVLAHPKKVKIRARNYYLLNKEDIIVKAREYRKNNKDKIKQIQKEYRIKNLNRLTKYLKRYRTMNKDKIAEQNNKYRKDNRTKIIERQRNRRINNIEAFRAYMRNWFRNAYYTRPVYKIELNLRSRIYQLLKGKQKSDATLKLLGCSVNAFRVYFESKFKNGMTWNLFMQGKIHIDHIKPCSSFNLEKVSEQQECFHWTNLQPLWAKDNLEKGAKLNWVPQYV